jgi:serine/threonine protein kinase
MPKMSLPPAESMRLDSLAEVARGGMGSVELARVMDGRLAGQIVAVKRLHANIAEDPDFVSMFLDEAWMTAALKHPNVVQVVAWGNDEKGMFLAIELVQGVSLSRLLKEAQLNQEPFAERTVAFICSQICGGLVAAHTLTTPDGTPLGIVHRDLTPANVLVSFDGMVKIIDFGIAKAEERISHTRTGQLKGKPAYMAPEQQRGAAIDARTDIFSFGVVMYELLAGRRPWTAKGAFDVMMEISNDPHPDLGELRKGLNPEFVAIAHRCLMKKPEDRFATTSEIKARLDTWLHTRGFSADDQQSLARFVLRNSQPQVLWWQEALRGEHAKKKAPTFKELEERIDEEREKAAKAARKPAKPHPGLSTTPMRAYEPPPDARRATPQPPPSSGPRLPNQTAQMMGVVPSQLVKPVAIGAPGQVAPTGGDPPYAPAQPVENLYGGAMRRMSPAPFSAVTPPSGPQAAPQPHGPASRRLVTGAGTEFLAISPFAQQQPDSSPASPPPYSGSRPAAPAAPYGRPLEATLNDNSAPPLMPLAVTPPMAPFGAPSGARSTGAGMPRVDIPQAAATLPVPSSGPTGAAQGAPTSSPSTPSAAPGATPSSAPAKKRSRAPVVIVLLLLVLGGAAGGLWVAVNQYGLNLGDLGGAKRPAKHP